MFTQPAHSYYTVTSIISLHIVPDIFFSADFVVDHEHSSQAYIRGIYASPVILSSISGPASVRVANCRVCKCTVCSGSSMISPRMFIIMRPTLCGEVRLKLQLRNRTRVPQWKICTVLGWKDALSPYYEYICAWNVHLRRDLENKSIINIWNYTQCNAC